METIVRELGALIDVIEQEETLRQPADFCGRAQAVDGLQAGVIAQIDLLQAPGTRGNDLAAARQRARVLCRRLEARNERLLSALRSAIRRGKLSGNELQQRLEAYSGSGPDEGRQNIAGYDELDTLVSRLLFPHAPPERTTQLGREMVFYQPTPARIILRLVETAGLRSDDLFYDLGSGLGQVVLLVNLLSGARARGIEFEPAYCEYARQRARALRLADVAFVAGDVRDAEFSDGTSFFMYTPFEGKMLVQVLDRLRVEAQSRTIRVYTYGPCTLVVSDQAWLDPLDDNHGQVYRLAAFRSVEKASVIGSRQRGG